MNYMNTFRLCVYGISIATVTVMIGFWFHKYEIEDRDIGVVDYVPLEDAHGVELPIPYLCFLDPFLKKEFEGANSNTTVTTYVQYLKGEVFDQKFQNINYQSVTLDLNTYLLAAYARFRNGSEFKVDNHFLTHKEIFSGVLGGEEFVKCFSFQNQLRQKAYIEKLYLRYNKTKLIGDLGASEKSKVPLQVHIFYPEQFLLQLNNPWLPSIDYSSLALYLWINNFELLQRRNTRKKKCTKAEKSFDELVLSKHIETLGCRPPYVSSHTHYPICNDQKKIREGLYNFKMVKNKYYPKACTRISVLRATTDQSIAGKVVNGSGYKDLPDWYMDIFYPEEVRLVKQSKEVDVHALIGNIGGYIGLFLGN